MQAVRTARGNSFCVDCDAPSKKCCTGKWGCSPGEEDSIPATSSPAPKRPGPWGCFILSCSVPVHQGRDTAHAATLVRGPLLTILGSLSLCLLGHWAGKGSGGQVPAKMGLLDYRRGAAESMLILTAFHWSCCLQTRTGQVSTWVPLCALSALGSIATWAPTCPVCAPWTWTTGLASFSWS